MAYKMVYLEKPTKKPFARQPFVKEEDVMQVTNRIYNNQPVLTEEEVRAALVSKTGKPFAKYIEQSQSKPLQDLLLPGESFVVNEKLNTLGYLVTNYYRICSISKGLFFKLTLNVNNNTVDNFSKRKVRVDVRGWLYASLSKKELVALWDEKRIPYKKRTWKERVI